MKFTPECAIMEELKFTSEQLQEMLAHMESAFADASFCSSCCYEGDRTSATEIQSKVSEKLTRNIREKNEN